jgi:hypothetical protein
VVDSSYWLPIVFKQHMKRCQLNWIVIIIWLFTYCFSFLYWNLPKRIYMWNVNKYVCDIIYDVIINDLSSLLKVVINFKSWLHFETDNIHRFALFKGHVSILFMCKSFISMLKWVSLTKGWGNPYLCNFFNVSTC